MRLRGLSFDFKLHEKQVATQVLASGGKWSLNSVSCRVLSITIEREDVTTMLRDHSCQFGIFVSRLQC